jgi:hypothetical protein
METLSDRRDPNDITSADGKSHVRFPFVTQWPPVSSDVTLLSNTNYSEARPEGFYPRDGEVEREAHTPSGTLEKIGVNREKKFGLYHGKWANDQAKRGICDSQCG